MRAGRDLKSNDASGLVSVWMGDLSGSSTYITLSFPEERWHRNIDTLTIIAKQLSEILTDMSDLVFLLQHL